MVGHAHAGQHQAKRQQAKQATTCRRDLADQAREIVWGQGLRAGAAREVTGESRTARATQFGLSRSGGATSCQKSSLPIRGAFKAPGASICGTTSSILSVVYWVYGLASDSP